MVYINLLFFRDIIELRGYSVLINPINFLLIIVLFVISILSVLNKAKKINEVQSIVESKPPPSIKLCFE